MNRDIKLAIILCFSALAVASCGGGSSSTPPVTPPPASGGGGSGGGGSGNPVIIADVVYGKGATDNGDIDLMLDIHQPSDICDANRPTIFYVHGGGFFGGSRSGGNHLARADAAHAKDINYVSISYRLVRDNPVLAPEFQAIFDGFVAGNTDPNTDLNQIEAAIAAYADALVALNWMQDNQNEYCMDTTRLAYWGGSAGAITVLNVAYSSDDFGFSRPGPDVVINNWGSLGDPTHLAFMEAPFMTVHGDQDQTVDYQSAVDIAAQADAVGVPYTFYTDVGGGHSVGVDRTVNGVTIMDLTLNFIEAHIVGGTPLYETANVD